MAVHFKKKISVHPGAQTTSIMGLDGSATSTGITIFSRNGSLLATYRLQPKINGAARLREIHEAFRVLLTKHAVGLVILEGYAYGNVNTLATLAEVGGVLRLAMAMYGVPYLSVSPNSLKQFATGKANAKKEEVMKDVYKRWGFDSPGNDIADAYVLGRVGLCLLELTPTENSIQKQVVQTIAKNPLSAEVIKLQRSLYPTAMEG
ncbi:crossover junction endodeoxyribonuclease RuvC [Roseococcus pinisoli]|uniref:Crossover junction endodeoxyribonuclease RuvC n=1 Tax=Roseococcus pinisoli TaxID=2835040 RepID=A0ABS5QFH3_9PROT|nr:crossover junction endodeoxyribonuclease RuvC [Roseococcus pinisoli]MBS7812319.1 crossover junction endodeoxyribonuclease RuvC [Roseococcus pinisoli]